MKKKCSSNAISINTPIVDCPAIIVDTPTGCIDPLTYFINLSINTAKNNKTNLDDIVFDYLTSGIHIPTSNQICCPDCTEAPFYSLTNADTFEQLASLLNWNISGPNLIDYCCINIDSFGTKYDNLMTTFKNGNKFPECCDNNFTQCLQSYTNGINYPYIADDGIVEVNSLNGKSGLCSLYNLLTNLPNGVFFKTTLTNFIFNFLAAGFVTHCCGCTITIRNVTRFQNYIQDNLCPDLNP